jgi:hypothetical protein
MELRDFVQLAGQAPSLQFLVIGGYAVAAHGHTRPTFDIDFLARQADREAWIKRLATAGFQVINSSPAFIQFSHPGGGHPFDLMLVAETTFEGMRAEALLFGFGDVSAPIPALDHLLALKLHALKQAAAGRTSKDAEDVEILARRHKLDLREPRYEKLFLKYASREIYETFLRILSR